MLKELLCISPIDQDLRRFCEIYFVAHDVMGRTAWGEGATVFEHYEWDRDDSYHEVCCRSRKGHKTKDASISPRGDGEHPGVNRIACLRHWY